MNVVIVGVIFVQGLLEAKDVQSRCCLDSEVNSLAYDIDEH